MVEKTDTIEKTNTIKEVLTSKKAKYIIGTVIFSGLGIAIPRIFHLLVGSSAGVKYLPMHLMVLISALTFGINIITSNNNISNFFINTSIKIYE